MQKTLFILTIYLFSFLTQSICAQEEQITPAADTIISEEIINLEEKTEEIDEENIDLAANKGSIFNRPNAKVMTLATPGIRGAILDRNGLPLAMTMVSYYPAIQFKQFDHDNKEKILAWGRKRIEHANLLFDTKWNPSDQELWEHYRYRRWMAMPYTFFVVNEELQIETREKLIEGLVLHPIYQRIYPNGESAAHIIGYTGIKGKLEKGPINYADPIFPYTHGRAGLEKIYDKQLQGKRGLKRIQYSSDGAKFPEETIQQPTIGANIISTLDLKWQKKAEQVLAEKCKRGALVVIDIETGEVLVLASRPSYDLNLFVPRALAKDYNKLLNDEDKPLFARSFQATYPPASSFKVIVALAALQNRYVTRSTTIPCPAYFEYNKHKFWDWSKSNKGNLNMIQAITRSNNPYFYTLGKNMKSSLFVDFARRFGFGEKSGLPLLGESAGNMPDDNWMLKYHNRRMHTGDHYNNAIGQGVILTTPLQVAQAMAAIANGKYLPKLSLIKQIQSPTGKVIAATVPDVTAPLKIDPLHIATVKEGMMNVVHNSAGTGKAGQISYATMCAKTGTGQWKPAHNQKVAWFAGFFPLNDPKYAFAALYEGDPDEEISGGRAAGTMVNLFFEPLKAEILTNLSSAVAVAVGAQKPTQPVNNNNSFVPKAVALDPETGEPVTSNTQTTVPKAVAIEPKAQAVEVEPPSETVPKAVPVTP